MLQTLAFILSGESAKLICVSTIREIRSGKSGLQRAVPFAEAHSAVPLVRSTLKLLWKSVKSKLREDHVGAKEEISPQGGVELLQMI